MIDAKEEQIRLYARQLKIPTFANYQDALRQCKPDAGFSELLLELMMAETASRQENQTRRRLKAAGFPFQKTLDDFDMAQLNPSVSPVFLRELASCKFIADRQNIVMIGNPGRGKTHIAIALGIKACLIQKRLHAVHRTDGSEGQLPIRPLRATACQNRLADFR